MSTDRPEVQKKVAPETLELRAKPRPVTRINRKVLLGGSALLLAFLSGAVWLALDPPDWRSGPERRELVETRRKAPPEGIEKLPSSYEGIPKLGPPNPGDIGKSIVRVEQDLGLEPPPALPTFKSDPEADFERAERIRLARLASQANESGLFFTLQTDSSAISGAAQQTANSITSPTNAFDPLTALANLTSPSQQLPEVDQNGQRSKLVFLQDGPDASIYNEHRVQQPASPFQLLAGTVISASLITALNSDLPGTIIAQVTEQTYDTVTGQHLLIPQGSRLIGRYDSNVTFGQDRALIVWQRIIRPDGSSIVIENLPGADRIGNAGVSDRVNVHTGRLIKGVLLSSLLGIGTELTFGDDEGDIVEAIRESAQQSTSRAGQQLVERTLGIQPTITVRPGWPIRVIVNKDIILPPFTNESR